MSELRRDQTAILVLVFCAAVDGTRMKRSATPFWETQDPAMKRKRHSGVQSIAVTRAEHCHSFAKGAM